MATHVTGPFISENGFVGDVIGDVTGNVAGAVTGPVTGPVDGDVTGAITLPTYTVATLPAAADNSGMLVHCSNGAAGSPCLAYSNGTDWLRIVFGAAVSAT